MPTYNKLVRDRIPDIIQSQGKSLKTRILDSDEYRSELRTKLAEEVSEYTHAQSDTEAIEELADVLEVIQALATAHGFTAQQLEEIRTRKAVERGAFQERIYLIEVEDA